MSLFHQSVLDKFVEFSAPLEGETHNPYLDVKGLLTVGIGCLIEGSMGYDLPWMIAGASAPRAEVIAQLKSLKSQQGLSHYAFNSKAVMGATSIRLTDAGILELCEARLRLIEPGALQAFPKFAQWPADAQLFWASLCWAEGSGAAHINPNLARLLAHDPPQFLLSAVRAPDPTHPGMFLPAADEISAKNNPGIIPRNAQNSLCLTNAQLVWDARLPVDVLHWPKSPLNDGATTVAAVTGDPGA